MKIFRTRDQDQTKMYRQPSGMVYQEKLAVVSLLIVAQMPISLLSSRMHI